MTRTSRLHRPLLPPIHRARCLAARAVLLASALPLAAQDSEPPAPRFVLEASFGSPGDDLQEQATQLRALHERFAPAGLRVRVLLPVKAIAAHADSEPPYEIGPCDATRSGTFVELRADDTPVWGHTSVDGLDDAVRLLLQGGDDRARLQQLEGLWRHVAYYAGDGPAVPETAARFVETAPSFGLAHALRYRDDLWNRADRAAARRDAATALRELAGHPFSLTVFCSQALRTDPYERETAAAIAAAVQPIVDADERRADAWLVWLRATLRCRPEVVTPELVEARRPKLSATRQLELAEILAGAPEATRFAAVATRALEAASAGDVPPDAQMLTSSCVLRACGGDRGAANRAMQDWLDRFGAGKDLNSLGWGLLTNSATFGRYDPVARVLLEWLLEESGGSTSDAWLDTLAMARYGSGDPAGALATQTQAIANGDGDPRYEVRRRRYEQAATMLQSR